MLGVVSLGCVRRVLSILRGQNASSGRLAEIVALDRVFCRGISGQVTNGPGFLTRGARRRGIGDI